jgi:D-sedoheptulose 7-phosphate isomerase
VSDLARARVRQLLDEAAAVQASLGSLTGALIRAAAACTATIQAGGRVLAFGNGGSAAEAQHFAAELSGRFQRERRPFGAIALTTDTSVLTAVGNDYGFEWVFSRQVEALGRPNDVAVGISTSGRSPNVIEGLKAARAAGLVTIAVSGPDPDGMAPHSDIVLAVSGVGTARIQEGQLTALHVICDLVDAAVLDGLVLSGS